MLSMWWLGKLSMTDGLTPSNGSRFPLIPGSGDLLLALEFFKPLSWIRKNLGTEVQRQQKQVKSNKKAEWGKKKKEDIVVEEDPAKADGRSTGRREEIV